MSPRAKSQGVVSYTTGAGGARRLGDKTDTLAR